MRGLRWMMVAGLLGVTTPAVAEEGSWQLVGGATAVQLPPSNGWGVGPMARFERHPSGVVGLDGALRVIVTSYGSHKAYGLGANLGVAVPFLRGPIDIAALGGGGMIAGGDSDGTPLAQGGPYVGLRLSGRITDWLGWSVAGSGHLWFYSVMVQLAPQVDAGLGVRF